MQVQVDLYNQNGKWKYRGRVECEKLPHEDGVLESLIEKQDFVVSFQGYFVILSDIPESDADPNYRMTYNRMYFPHEVNAKLSIIETVS